MATTPRFDRPGPDEHHAYYSLYIDQVRDGDILDTLEHQIGETAALLKAVPPSLETHRYAPGKWSIREVVGHMIDTERVFGFRGIHFARSDPAPLPSFEQEDWARVSSAHERPLADLVDELLAVRRGHVLFFRGLDAAAPLRRGVASGREFTVRSVPWIMAGHELHHTRILRERYLPTHSAPQGAHATSRSP